MAKRKLVEAAIPLDAINDACKADKERKVGTIRNLHKWFAPMPLPAWRALLFATLVDDPDDERDRDRLMRLIERLVASGGDLPPATVLDEARREIERCWPGGVPDVADPFCGGGSTLIEAQRLGCRTVGSDLNPVPALLSRVLTDSVPALAGQPPLSEETGRLAVQGGPHGGLIADAQHYAGVVRDAAKGRVADYYPQRVADGVPVAWLWCRTVRCPNPACGARAPLLDSTWLMKKRGSEAHLRISYEPGDDQPQFSVAGGTDCLLPWTVERSGATCARCLSVIPFSHVRREGSAGRLEQRMTAIMVQRGKQRVFVAPQYEQEALALAVPESDDPPRVAIDPKGLGIRTPPYGLTTQADLYTKRQLLTLNAFAAAVREVPKLVQRDGGDEVRAQAIAAVLGLCVGKLAQYLSSQALIGPTASGTPIQSGFTRNDLPMTWDFAEANPFASVGPSWDQLVVTALRALPLAPTGKGTVVQGDARTVGARITEPVVFATDPPYFDQIGYADLSDYFYVWLRKALRPVFPDLFATVATPKQAELIALPSRHASKDAARDYFVDGFTETFRSLASAQIDDAPMLIVYAFKEQGTGALDGVAPGWEAILAALIRAKLTVVGTWPIRGTGSSRMRAMGANALATYVVLVCRPRAVDASRITRAEFARALKAEMADAVVALQKANIAPVDLAQAVIGPGMEVYSRHSAVLETDGSRVGVADALVLVNRTLAEVLDEQEGDLDPDSRWAATWYEEHGFEPAPFGRADQLARAKGIAVDALVRAGIASSGAGRVALLRREQLVSDWDPSADPRATSWEGVQHLVRALDAGGESAAAQLYARLGSLAVPARELAYRLFQIAEKKGWTDEAIAYNSLVSSWPDIARLADNLPSGPSTEALF